ncbi:MAG: ABC transporter ATP-binding protein [Nanoarchaeota archaeon]|nr:ABC transporter ATP-binding protein [Nanoarchaeota archaeon]
MDTELIQFKGVSKKFGKNVVLDNIDLTIPEGKITGIIGASGEGKSTILKMIVSFYKPNRGNIFYLRRNIKKGRFALSKIFGLSVEDGSFYEKLSVKENLFHFGRLFHVKRKILRKRVEEIIGLMDLTKAENTLAGDLSIGMKKRLDIGCSLIHNPAVLILDEPTADLDPLLREQITNLIKKINSHGTTVILTTQLLSEAEDLCDRIAILYNEKIVEEGSPKKIKQKYKSSSLDDVFKKIFSKKGRKTYQESSEKKSKVEKSKKKSSMKKSLVVDSSKLYGILDKLDKEGKDGD